MMPSATRQRLVTASVDIIERNQTPTGAYIAAPGYDTYNFSWIRDGSFIATAMDVHGVENSATRFHDWAADTIRRHSHKINALIADHDRLARSANPLQPLDDHYVLHTRYTLDGHEGDTEWGNFQLDGYGFWLTSLNHHLCLTGSDPDRYRDSVDAVASYLEILWPKPCYDCWEEYPTRRHSTTWAAIAQGLRSAAELTGNTSYADTADEIVEALIDSAGASMTLRKFVPEDGPAPTDGSRVHSSETAVAGHERIGRNLPAETIDGSALLVLDRFGPFAQDQPVVSATLDAIDTTLVADGGGVHRYIQDEYYGGGLWIVLAGALAIATARTNPERTTETIDWIERQADGKGHLPEQVPTHLRSPSQRQPWIDRWGPPASTLLWSHAMYLMAVAAQTREG